MSRRVLILFGMVDLVMFFTDSPAGPALITCADVWILMQIFPGRLFDDEFGFD